MAKIIYRDRDNMPLIKAKCGQKIWPTYDLQYDKDHIVRIVKTGEKNVYAEIQQYKDDNDLSHLLKTIQATGNELYYACDESQLRDTTNFPQSLLEAKQFVENANKMYDSLPKELTKGESMESFVKNNGLSRYVEHFVQQYLKEKGGIK